MKNKLLLGIFVLLISLNIVFGAQVCCEKVKGGGFCENTDSANCETGFKNSLDSSKGYWSSAATSCALTSFCKPGCCFNPSQDGLCYVGYAKSACEDKSGIFDGSDSTCTASAQCKEGCCVIGSEASLMTEAKCKLETAKFPQLQMEFKTDITDEVKCVDIARQAEKGCCAKDPNSCIYGARLTCDAAQSSTTGFFSGKYCSQLDFCNCAPHSPDTILKKPGDGKPKDNTLCLANSDDVYWKDSCGNPEGIVTQKVLTGNTDGNCEYISGTLCGDSDKDGVYTCESLNCENSGAKNNLLSLNLKDYAGSIASEVKSNGILNGESWCLADSVLQNKISGGGKDPVGSRYYRSVCVNGKEVVEPCEDFRKEWCVDSPIYISASENEKITKEKKIFFEAGCVKNRVEDCLTSCNTLSFGNVDAKNSGDVQKALNADYNCCMNTDVRDCKWIGPTADSKIDVPAFGKGTFSVYCVPFSKPGTKFWESEGSDICAKASLTCEVGFECPGTGVLLGMLAGKECAGGKATRLGGEGKTAWKILYGSECLKPQWIQAANDVCRMVGDCGADTNLYGKTTYGGFTNTPSISHDFAPFDESGNKKVPGFLDTALKGPGIDNYQNRLINNFDYNEKDQGKFAKFFSGNSKSNKIPVIFNGVYGTLAGLGAAKGWKFATTLTGVQGVEGAKFFSGFWSGFKSTIPKLGLGKILGKGGSVAGTTQAAASNLVTTQQYSNSYTNVINTLNSKISTYKTYLGSGVANPNPLYAKQLSTMQQLQIELAPDSLNGGQLSQNLVGQLNDVGISGPDVNTLASPQQITKSTFGGLHWLNTAMWIWTAYNLINTYMAKTETVIITTTCSPWVAPVPTTTGDICQKCNPDEYINENIGIKTYTSMKALLVCSEYKCKSLGAACGIINAGTSKQKCVNLNPHDTRSPLIDYWKEGTSKELDLFNPTIIPRTGVEFLNGEIPAYQRVTLGIKTDEPSQCKMSFKNGIKYEQMEPFYFGDATYEYFHTTILTYPKDVNSTDSTLKFGQPGQIYQLYVRCQDALGNVNEKDYVIKFKVSQGPDITPPTIETTSLGTLPAERYLSVGTSATDIELFLNEAATCKWSNYDIDYNSMPIENECTALNSNMNNGLYSCKFNQAGKESETIGEPLKGFNDTEFKFYYFRCKDQPSCKDGKTPEGKECTRNVNVKSDPNYVLTLRKSYNLNLSEITPSGNIYIGGIGGNISLEARTSNGAEKNGMAYCGFTTTESQKNNVWGMSAFFNTNSSYHSQILSQLSTGSHTFYIGCADAAGNTVYGQTTFNLALDNKGPVIARAFIDSSSGTDIFKIRTDEEAVCEYSITGTFNYGEGNAMLTDDGTTHSAQGGVNTYYVICEDKYNNQGSLTTVNFLL